VPPNPLLGLSYDSAFIRDFLDTISGPIILVGHSYGGAVITNAATGDKRSRRWCTWRPSRRRRGRPSVSWSAPIPVRAQSVFPSCMANGLPASEAAVLAATQRPLASLALAQTSGVPAGQRLGTSAGIAAAGRILRHPA
jgi:pimeloyl-ACP methyl ester carboxylesterase